MMDATMIACAGMRCRGGAELVQSGQIDVGCQERRCIERSCSTDGAGSLRTHGPSPSQSASWPCRRAATPFALPGQVVEELVGAVAGISATAPNCTRLRRARGISPELTEELTMFDLSFGPRQAKTSGET